MYNIKGKTVLITGANRGIGLAFVKACLDQGAEKILAAGRDSKAIESVVALQPEAIEAIELDVNSCESIQKLTQIDTLDVLINNAGIAVSCFNLAENALAIAQQEMNTNYFGPLQITQTLMPTLKQSPQAAVINIASVAALSNFPSFGPYSATKAALMSFTQGLRIELAGSNVSAICVYPGPTDTRLAPGDVPKATPESIAINTLTALNDGELDIYPDDFSKAMFATFSGGVDKLAQSYAAMHG